MSATAQLRELLNDRATVVPLSVEQYHRMIETGILESGEPIELLDGYLVRKDRSTAGADPMTVGSPHMLIVLRLPALCAGAEAHGCHFRPQAPITLDPDSEPEPDGLIARGTLEDYADRHPGPQDICCLIEVSDSSLRRDRITKRRIYADAGIPHYVIVNLVEEQVEDSRRPLRGSGRYEKTDILRRGSVLTIELPDGGTLEIPVDRLLP